MESLKVEDVWPLIERLDEAEREKLKARLVTHKSADERYWSRVDRRAAEMASAGCSFTGDAIVRMIREDREGR